MKRLLDFVVFSSIICIARSASAMNSHKLVFSPETGVTAAISSQTQEVKITLTSGSTTTTDKISVDTEKPLNVVIEDYNFDGRKDFSISHVDDGMGTYIVYDVYIYSHKTRKFIPLRPKCGDQFINLKLSKSKQVITSSYFSDNRLKICISKY